MKYARGRLKAHTARAIELSQRGTARDLSRVLKSQAAKKKLFDKLNAREATHAAH